jgi:BolA protein
MLVEIIMTIFERISQKIAAAFPGAVVYLEDQSARHAGHAGAAPGGETHFLLEVTSESFEGVSRVERQRMVHAVLKEELAERVHALSLSLKTPAEQST